MRIKGAMTILNKRAKFYGVTVDELINFIDNGFDESIKVLQAYEVFKQAHGYIWSGVNFRTWIKAETA